MYLSHDDLPLARCPLNFETCKDSERRSSVYQDISVKVHDSAWIAI